MSSKSGKQRARRLALKPAFNQVRSRAQALQSESSQQDRRFWPMQHRLQELVRQSGPIGNKWRKCLSVTIPIPSERICGLFDCPMEDRCLAVRQWMSKRVFRLNPVQPMFVQIK